MLCLDKDNPEGLAETILNAAAESSSPVKETKKNPEDYVKIQESESNIGFDTEIEITCRNEDLREVQIRQNPLQFHQIIRQVLP